MFNFCLYGDRKVFGSLLLCLTDITLLVELQISHTGLEYLLVRGHVYLLREVQNVSCVCVSFLISAAKKGNLFSIYLCSFIF